MPKHQKRIQQIIWKGLYYQTLEYCLFTRNSGYTIDGTILGEIANEPWSMRYQVVLDAAYRTRFLSVFQEGRRLNHFELRRSATGWHDHLGKHLPEFDACIDIDIALTPSTNTLPIRRLSFIPQVPQEIKVLYIDPVTQSRRVDVQVYTQLELGLYRYRNPDTGFTALLPVDAAGIVGDYNGLWRRLYPLPDLHRSTPVAATEGFTNAGSGSASSPAVLEPERLYQLLLGDWQVMLVEPEAGGQQNAVGQWYFGAIMEDQVIQEVIPLQSLPALETGLSPDQRYRTTIRRYDALKKQWAIHGFEPGKRDTNPAIGYGSADHIIEEDQDANGVLVRQRFFDMGSESFQCIRERSTDGGTTWFTVVEFFARRK